VTSSVSYRIRFPPRASTQHYTNSAPYPPLRIRPLLTILLRFEELISSDVFGTLALDCPSPPQIVHNPAEHPYHPLILRRGRSLNKTSDQRHRPQKHVCRAQPYFMHRWRTVSRSHVQEAETTNPTSSAASRTNPSDLPPQTVLAPIKVPPPASTARPLSAVSDGRWFLPVPAAVWAGPILLPTTYPAQHPSFSKPNKLADEPSKTLQ